MYNEQFSHTSKTFGSENIQATTITIGYIKLHQGLEC